LWAYSNEEQADDCVEDCGLRNMGVFIWNRWKVCIYACHDVCPYVIFEVILEFS
jgi:hypothetical protein